MAEYTERALKIEILKRSVEECSDEGEPADKERLIAYCATEWGDRRQKAQEFLKQLEATREIFIEKNDVWSRERWAKILAARAKDYLGMEDIIKGNKTL